MNKCIFVDRDGTLNIEKNYLHKYEDFEWVKGAKESLEIFIKLGYKIIVVTNQSGIARGYYTEDDLKKLHNKIQEELINNNIKINEYYYCPHHKDGIGKYKKECNCRKPEIKIFEKAKQKYEIDYSKSFVIGDKLSDVEVALRLGMTPILVRTGHGKEEEKKIYFKSYIYENIFKFAIELEKN